MPIEEHHRQHRVGWLRAAVLGANDGIVSTASLVIGVASAQSDHKSIIVAGVAGLIAGAISMAAGEYVSVCTQRDTEEADLDKERYALKHNYEAEVIELATIYEDRGVEKSLSKQVARQMMEKDALATHARDEIGISELTQAQPLLAAASSAASFTVGAILPILIAVFYMGEYFIPVVAASSLVFLASLGATSAYLGGAKLVTGILRVSFWGALAMMITALVGEFVGIVV